MSRYRITDADLVHARAFLDDPFAPAGPGLQRVLNRMRTDTRGGKYVLIVDQPWRRWTLARLPMRRGAPVERLDARFDDRAEAERAVFRLRWQALTDSALPW